MNDGGRWHFDQSGKPFPFEDVARYQRASRRERFPVSLLVEYLAQLGLRPFESDYYLPPNGLPALLVEKHGPTAIGLKEISLEDCG